MWLQRFGLDSQIGLREQHRTANTTGTMSADNLPDARMLLAPVPLTTHTVCMVRKEPFWERIRPDVTTEREAYVLVFKPCWDAPWQSDLADKESVQVLEVFKKLLGGGVTVTVRAWQMNCDRKESPMELSGGFTEITHVFRF